MNGAPSRREGIAALQARPPSGYGSRMTSLPLRLSVLGTVLLLAGVVAGCRASTSDPDAGPRPDTNDGVGTPCLSAFQCASGLACTSGFCAVDPTHDSGTTGNDAGADHRDAGVGLGSDAGPLPGTVGFQGACSPTEHCRFGLTCNLGVCEGSGDGAVGSACELTSTCGSGLYCAAGVCATAGTGSSGDPCTDGSMCRSGLRCTSGMCVSTGTDDIGDTCLIPTECAAGLECVSGMCRATTSITPTGCEADVDAVRAACAAAQPTSPRLCIYDAIRPLCSTGRASFISAMFACLSSQACQTPADPGTATDCVRALIASQVTPIDTVLGFLACVCDDSDTPQPGCGSWQPQFTLATTMLMSLSEVGALAGCIDTLGCGSVNDCVSLTSTAPILACH